MREPQLKVTSILSINHIDRKRLDPKPAYQRGEVWTLNQKQLFIDSLLNGFDIPKLYYREINDAADAEVHWEVLDGQQRLKSIFEFYDGNFPLSKGAKPIQGEEIAGRYFGDLSMNCSTTLAGRNLDIVVVKGSDDEIAEMFLRLNSGLPLNPAEKRNAISGGLRNFVSKIASTHKLFTNAVAFSPGRYSHDESVAQMLRVEQNGGQPTNVRHSDLKLMYENGKKFDENQPVAKKLKKVLTFLAKAFPEKSPELTKVKALSLYTLVSRLMTELVVTGKAEKFGKWFIDFDYRVNVNKTKDEDLQDHILASYQRSALGHGTADRSSQERRLDILANDLMERISDLAPLDDEREFTDLQRQIIFRKADGKCNNPSNNPDCAVKCSWDSFHADHIKPYSKGGPTTIINGQLLCPSCNLKKSDKY